METKKSPWLKGWGDVVASMHTQLNCVKLIDTTGNAIYRLVIAEQSGRLVCYCGTTIEWETKLPGKPIGITYFYAEQTNPMVPFIAVGVETGVYIYKVFKKFYNFVLPKIGMGQTEQDAWMSFKQDNEIQKLVNSLNDIKQSELELTYISMELLSYSSAKKQLELAQSVESFEFEDIITCIETYKKGSDDEYALGQLLLGTEYKRLYLLEPDANKVQKEVLLGGTPITICCTLEGDIGVLLRENKIQVLQNLEITVKVDLHSKPITMIKQGVTFIVAMMDYSICSYNIGGQKLFTIQFQEQILCLESLEYGKTKGLKGILVGLKNKSIKFYVDKVLISTIDLEYCVDVMKFGIFGREDGFLISIDERGGILTHSLQRQFNAQDSIQKSRIITRQQIESDAQQIQIPKKTKLFVEQAKREQEQGVNMHQIYQYDLIRLRLKSAQTYLNIIEDDQLGPQLIQTNTFRLQAQVNGLGPLFKINCQLENLGQNSLMNAFINVSYNIRSAMQFLGSTTTLRSAYKVLTTQVLIMLQDLIGANDIVKIYIFSSDRCQPLIGAIINMPLSDLQMD